MHLLMFKVEWSFFPEGIGMWYSEWRGKTCPGVGNTLKWGASPKGKKLQKGLVHMFNHPSSFFGISSCLSIPTIFIISVPAFSALPIPTVSQGAFRLRTPPWDCWGVQLLEWVSYVVLWQLRVQTAVVRLSSTYHVSPCNKSLLLIHIIL